MGDFSEHVLFGFLAAAVAGYVFKDWISISFFESLAALILLFAGSILPDVDHENSYIHRAVKSFLSISAAATVLYFLPLKVHYSFALAAITLLTVYYGVSKLRPRHRGFIHSPRFALYVSAIILSATVLLFNSIIPGAAFTIGVFSHLLLDQELF